ncbi:MAG: hypothetical protein B7Y99_11935 [Caulobacterales bacterium 32-69-10]|nr:MAG: hypothetical protein B7Y99_11935 [Caulobacterales bacterium 32-69-10]
MTRSASAARTRSGEKATTAKPAEQARSVATREKLIETSIVGFSRVGYDGYSSRMIAADSGVHQALIAYHFGNKLGLWKACLLRMSQDLREHLASRNFEGSDDVTRLKIWCEEFIRHNSRRPQLQAMAIDAVGRNDGRFEWVLEAFGHAAHESWRALIISAQSAGRFVSGDPGMLLNIFLGAAIRIYVMAPETEYNLGRSPFDPDFVEEHVRTCMALFFRDEP